MRSINLSAMFLVSSRPLWTLALCFASALTTGCGPEADVDPSVPAVAWSRAYGEGVTSGNVSAISVGASGNVALTGTYSGSLDFGGGPLESTSEPSFYIAKVDAAGDPIWSGRTGGGDDFAAGIALDRGGSALVTGSFNGFVDFGPAGELNGVSNIFLARFGATGLPTWSKQFGNDSSPDAASDIAIDKQGGVHLMGRTSGDTDFGQGPIAGGQWQTFFVAELSSSGNAIWSRGFTSQNYIDGRKMTVDSNGNTIVYGEFYGELDLGGGAISSFDAYGMFLVKLDSNGDHVWSKVVTSQQGSVQGTDIAVDTDGSVLLTGTFGGTVDFGGGPIVSDQNYAGSFVVKLAADGTHQWTRSFAPAVNSGYHQSVGVGADGEGNVFFAGSFSGSIDFGGGALVSESGQQDIFIVKLDPKGAHVASRSFGDDSFQYITAFAMSPSGMPVLAGFFSGSLDFGSSKLEAPDIQRLFVAAVDL